MDYVFVTLIILSALYFVAQPLWRLRIAAEVRDTPLADWLEQRDNMLAQIKELEFEYQTGKVSREDFEEINGRYRSEVIGILHRIDSDQIKGNGHKQESGPSLSLLKSGFCPECGKAVSPRDRFCSNCGKPVSAKGGRK